MQELFLICAAVGGTVFLCQFVLTLMGIGSDDFDVSHDVPHDMGGGDAAHWGGVGGHDVSGGDHGGDGATHGHSHGSTWLFGVISFRTVVAALTFFGLAGFAALQGGQAAPTALVLAVICGGAAMYGVHWLMQVMYRLGQDHTLRIGQAIGRRGAVYVPIPGSRSGEGKVQVTVQERIVEYVATTSGADELPTGAQVVVTRVVRPGVVEVELAPQPVKSTEAS